ncbi:MAG: TatD family hydrolase [Proteobacteria bacterium]|nr:TatD family hydrolase [Pseudomonadota bacterium]MBU1739262.1 TatD family hydrolase [Pseudomonadota bacterium]
MSKKRKIEYPQLAAGSELVDTHCHLDMAPYHDDLDDVLETARRHGVRRVITVGIDAESSARAVGLAEKYPNVYATVGAHPHHAAELDEDVYRTLAGLAQHPKVVAYGEIGIDLFHNFSPPDVQREHFSRQVKLAIDLKLPVIIHDRDAHLEVMDILESAAPFPAGGVMHCFSGDRDLAARVVALGFHISIPGVVTFKKSEILQEAVCRIPPASLLLETDGPYLAPEPRRGRRNEPAFLLFTAARVAELKGVSLDDLAAITTANAEKLFSLPPLGKEV